MRLALPLICLALAGCVETTQSPEAVSRPPEPAPKTTPKLSEAAAMRNFNVVVGRVEKVAERECNARTRNANCDFMIRVDGNTKQPPNAYQTIDRKSGRPLIVFNKALIGEARNQHEVAFVLGHEAAHHIRGHIARQQKSAIAGALLGSVIAAAAGANDVGINAAQDLGGTVGGRAFSKDMEIEADKLGAVIAHRAGYNPRKGAQFFFRIPDPGDRFLGTHPPNAKRRAAVNDISNKLGVR